MSSLSSMSHMSSLSPLLPLSSLSPLLFLSSLSSVLSMSSLSCMLSISSSLSLSSLSSLSPLLPLLSLSSLSSHLCPLVFVVLVIYVVYVIFVICVVFFLFIIFVILVVRYIFVVHVVYVIFAVGLCYLRICHLLKPATKQAEYQNGVWRGGLQLFHCVLLFRAEKLTQEFMTFRLNIEMEYRVIEFCHFFVEAGSTAMLRSLLFLFNWSYTILSQKCVHFFLNVFVEMNSSELHLSL